MSCGSAVLARRTVALGTAVAVGYVAFRAWRNTLRAARRQAPSDEPPARSLPNGDAVELCDFTVTCPRCADRTRVVRWRHSPADRPDVGPCPRCGEPHRQVATGIRRGIRLAPPPSLVGL